MSHCTLKTLLLAALAFLSLPSVTAADWKTISPEAAGFSPSKLQHFREALAAKGTKGLFIAHRDAILLEWYAAPMATNKGHYTASMAKALLGGMTTAILLSDHRINLDQPVSQYIPEWKNDFAKSRITFRQLGSHTSGLEDAEQDDIPHNKLAGWKGDFWKRLPPPNDPFTISRDITPLITAPGEKFQYSNPGIAMLGYALTAALPDSQAKDLRSLLRDRVMRPIGIPDDEWSVGYGQTIKVNGLDLVPPWGGGNFTARATAAIGLLMLQKGNWQGREILEPDAVDAVTKDAGTPGFCGIGWWSNNDLFTPGLPRDAFWAAGAQHQVLLVVPSWNIIAVRNGADLDPANYDQALRKHFFEPLAACRLASTKPEARAPYPPSPVIASIQWAPRDQIIRQARGSDNWPITWGNDDHLYTAYGDGNGFEPRLPEKLSLGLARITGHPPNFTATNLRSPSIEQKGDGKRGRKASGLIMVQGRLYMWLRNATNAQLAWSDDRAATWTFANWRFEKSFGCPTFLNFGPDYQNVRDHFVYIYSHDSDSAYTRADRFVLARVPSNKIEDLSAYEFLQHLDQHSNPVWTKNLDKRGAVFTNPDRCYRSGITYNSALKRYLWCQTLLGEDTRFGGGLAIFDAPEPWGPWTAAFYTEEWDTGPGETSSFPTKWMSQDGKTLWLVFSGDDYFSVRKATLNLRK